MIRDHCYHDNETRMVVCGAGKSISSSAGFSEHLSVTTVMTWEQTSNQKCPTSSKQKLKAENTNIKKKLPSLNVHIESGQISII